MKENKAERMLHKLQENIPIPTELKYSFKGVPHLLLIGGDNITYSICYFGKSKLFKIFYPYPSNRQTRVICKLYTDVLKFFDFELVGEKNGR